MFPQVATHDEYYNPQNDTFAVEHDIGHARIRKKGEVLHPQRFNERMITRMRQTMQPRHWSALHQQNPVPDEGDIFTKSMFRYEPVVPDWREWDIYIAGDLALGKKQHNDWSVLVVGAMDYEGQLHMIEMSRFKGGADPITENLLALLRRYEKRLVRFGLEEGQIQMAIWPEIERKIIQEKLHVTVASGKHALKPVSDKLARSRVAQAMMQQGRIIWPENQPWVEDARSELLRFPGGIHDDMVDMLAWLGTVDGESPGSAAQAAEETQVVEGQGERGVQIPDRFWRRGIHGRMITHSLHQSVFAVVHGKPITGVTLTSRDVEDLLKMFPEELHAWLKDLSVRFEPST